MNWTNRFRTIAPWLLFGPITAALAAGMLRNLQRHEPVLASLYGFALAVVEFDLVEFGHHAIRSLDLFTH